MKIQVLPGLVLLLAGILRASSPASAPVGAPAWEGSSVLAPWSSSPPQHADVQEGSPGATGPEGPREGSRQGGGSIFDPTHLYVPNIVTGTTTGYTNLRGMPGPEVYYSFIQNDQIPVTISLCGTTPEWDALLYLYRIDESTYWWNTPISFRDDDCGLLPRFSSTLLAPGEYIIMIDGKTAASHGDYTLEVDPWHPCDEFAQRELGDISILDEQETFGQTSIYTDYVFPPPGENDWEFTVSRAGTYTFSTCHPRTSFHTRLYLSHISVCAGPLILPSTWDTTSCDGPDPLGTILRYHLEPGTYHLVVTGQDVDDNGEYGLIVTPPCFPPDCDGLLLENEPAWTDADTTNGGCALPGDRCSSLACGDALCGSFHTVVDPVDGSLRRDEDWYRFTVEQPTRFSVETFSCAAAYEVALYLEESCSEAARLAQTSGTEALYAETDCLAPGSYRLVVRPAPDTALPQATPYRLRLTCSEPCNLPPVIVHEPLADTHTPGPWPIQATVQDSDPVSYVLARYAVDGVWNSGMVWMEGEPNGQFVGSFPAMPPCATVEYYVETWAGGENPVRTPIHTFHYLDTGCAPTALAASGGGAQVELDWSYPATAATEAARDLSSFLGFRIYRDGQWIATVPGIGARHATDLPPSLGVRHDYQVTASWTDGESAPSNSDPGYALGPATRGGPDAFGYTWVSSQDPSGELAFAFEDIRGTGTPLPLGDNEISDFLSLPTFIRFYGMGWAVMRVGSNGVLGFADELGSLLGSTLLEGQPPFQLVAPYWCDLVPQAPGASVHVLSDVEQGRFIAQYHVPAASNPTVFLDFQVILHASGDIRVNYLDLDETPQDAGLCGIVNADGSSGLVVSRSGLGAQLGDQVSLLFRAPELCTPITQLSVSLEDSVPCLVWPFVPGAFSYEIFCSDSAYGPFSYLGYSMTPSFRDSSAPEDGQRFYQVQSVCE